MRIFFDPERGDYRLSVDTSDRNDCEPFLERYGTDTQAACIMRHLVELANEHQPPAGLRTRRSWALALCRFLAFLYGEDLSSDPSTPTLARMTMRRAAEHFAALPTLDHEPTDRARACQRSRLGLTTARRPRWMISTGGWANG